MQWPLDQEHDEYQQITLLLHVNRGSVDPFLLAENQQEWQISAEVIQSSCEGHCRKLLLSVPSDVSISQPNGRLTFSSSDLRDRI